LNSDKSQEEEIKDSLNFKLYITVYFFGTQLKELELILNYTRLTIENVKRINKHIFGALKDTIFTHIRSEANTVNSKLP